MLSRPSSGRAVEAPLPLRLLCLLPPPWFAGLASSTCGFWRWFISVAGTVSESRMFCLVSKDSARTESAERCSRRDLPSLPAASGRAGGRAWGPGSSPAPPEGTLVPPKRSSGSIHLSFKKAVQLRQVIWHISSWDVPNDLADISHTSENKSTCCWPTGRLRVGGDFMSC